MNDTPAVAVVFDAPAVTPKVQAHWYHYVAAFLWNLYRKPMVWKRQRELKELFETVRGLLKVEVFPNLQDNIHSCTDCRNALMALRPQVFMSQIELILKQMRCPVHSIIYDRFLSLHGYYFRKSEELARWINGL